MLRYEHVHKSLNLKEITIKATLQYFLVDLDTLQSKCTLISSLSSGKFIYEIFLKSENKIKKNGTSFSIMRRSLNHSLSASNYTTNYLEGVGDVCFLQCFGKENTHSSYSCSSVLKTIS